MSGPGARSCLRFLTGFALAGVYPPGMKLVATWCKEDRGFGIGLLVGRAHARLRAAAPAQRRAAARRRRDAALAVGALRDVRHGGRRRDHRRVPAPARPSPFRQRALRLAVHRTGVLLSTDAARERRIPGPHVGAVRDVGVGAGAPARELAPAGAPAPGRGASRDSPLSRQARSAAWRRESGPTASVGRSSPARA